MVRPELHSTSISRRRATRNDGFTLIELLIVIAIIGVLVALFLPTINSSRRRARILECGTHLREMGVALTMYTQRYGRYPDATGPALLEALRTKGQPPVLEDADKLFVCPLTGTAEGPGACDYRGASQPITEGRLKHSTPIACDKEGNHEAEESINVLYPNGRVEEAHRDSPRYGEALGKTQ